MLKKIPAEQLRPGMFVHDLDCGWFDHPFLRARFLVATAADVDKVCAAGIHDVYIDTERGDDVRGAPTVDEVKSAVEQAMVAVAQVAVVPAPFRVPAREEYDRARKVLGEATTIVQSVMTDVRLGHQVEVEQIEPAVERMSSSILRNSSALLALCRVKNKDNYTFRHSVSVGALLIAFSRHLGLDDATIHQSGIGGMLHDIGKVRVPSAILNKPGRLTEAEFATMQQHVVESRRVVEAIQGVSNTALEVAAQHHERFDGSGYPSHLSGDAISQFGQMAAICDVYDAITSERVYHKGMTPAEAMRKIFEWSKFHFNPQLVQGFLHCIGIYPVGTLIRLESGRLGVVTDQHEGKLLQPQVTVMYDAGEQRYLPPEELDLSHPSCNDRIIGRESETHWNIDPALFL